MVDEEDRNMAVSEKRKIEKVCEQYGGQTVAVTHSLCLWVPCVSILSSALPSGGGEKDERKIK